MSRTSTRSLYCNHSKLDLIFIQQDVWDKILLLVWQDPLQHKRAGGTVKSNDRYCGFSNLELACKAMRQVGESPFLTPSDWHAPVIMLLVYIYMEAASFDTSRGTMRALSSLNHMYMSESHTNSALNFELILHKKANCKSHWLWRLLAALACFVICQLWHSGECFYSPSTLLPFLTCHSSLEPASWSASNWGTCDAFHKYLLWIMLSKMRLVDCISYPERLPLKGLFDTYDSHSFLHLNGRGSQLGLQLSLPQPKGCFGMKLLCVKLPLYT